MSLPLPPEALRSPQNDATQEPGTVKNAEMDTAIAAAGFMICLGLVGAAVIVSDGVGRTVSDGVTGADLELAFVRCEPPQSTFAQTLACTQAVYGGFYSRPPAD